MIELSRAPAIVPPGRRVYAIGDIHGCDAQLADLHAIIAEDLARRPVDQAVLLHIGDYVDRGADTAGVLRRLLNGSPVAGAQVVNLVGNHDETMLNALSGDRAAATRLAVRRWPASVGKLRRRSRFAARVLAGARAVRSISTFCAT